MAGTTSKGLRFPQNADAPNVAVDIQNLATDVDTELNDYLTLSTAASTYTTLETAKQEARVINFLLGGL